MSDVRATDGVLLMFCYKCGKHTSTFPVEPNGNPVFKCERCQYSSAIINGKLVIADPTGRIVSLQQVNVE